MSSKGGSKTRKGKLGCQSKGRKPVAFTNEKAFEEKKYEKALALSNVDLHLDANRKDHHTDEFDLKELILRRGQSFWISLTFHRNISKEQDDIALKFITGPRPQESKGTLIRLHVDPKEPAKEQDNDEWYLTTFEVSGKTVNVKISSAADANIGLYQLLVETKLKDDTKELEVSRSNAKCDLYMLFNPWHIDDTVFMKNDAERNEYVLNETGKVWMGNARSNKGLPWNYGQFEEPVLKVALDLLDKGGLGDAARNSPVSITRCISALVNCNDDDGVLVGRWYDDYADGTNPCAWTGSVAILAQYHETGLPVKYGQCWVFSALTTSLMRALGIPTRSVTNFESAHDTDCSMTIDYHFDSDGKPIDSGMDDSIWNFHVWNESWFKRNDLPEGYDGWQAHDATPQEESAGVSRCGPAPVVAVKKGHVYLNFDVGFLFAEVNGDKIDWQVNDDGSMHIMGHDSKAVGKNISTKAVGDDARHDLTLDYKHVEGSTEDCEARQRVYRKSTRKEELLKRIPSPLVQLESIVPIGKGIGMDLGLGVQVTNTRTAETIKIRVRLTLANAFYTGVVGPIFKDETVETELKGGETKALTMDPLKGKGYESSMNAQASFRLAATCLVLEQQYNCMYAVKKVFELDKPELFIKAPEYLACYETTNVNLEMTNTTTLPFDNGVFTVGGNHCNTVAPVKIKKPIAPGEKVSVEVKIYCYQKGQRTIIANFCSDQVDGITSEHSLPCRKD